MILPLLLFTLWLYLYLRTNSVFNSVVGRVALSFFAALTLMAFVFIIALFVHINHLAISVFMSVVGLVLLILHLRKNKLTPLKFNFIPQNSWIIALIAILGFCINFFNTTHRWGEWDNWAIWSMHAKFLFHGSQFTNLFSNKIAWTHPDYPLLVPSVIAMLWKNLNTIGPVVPVMFAFICGLGIPFLAYSSLKELGYKQTGYFALLLLTWSPLLFPFVTSQYADTPLGLYFLIPFILWNQLSQHKKNSIVFLVGFFAAASCHIKNEGIPFFALFSFFFLFKNFSERKVIRYYIFGTCLPILLLIAFKVFYAPANDLMEGGGSNSMQAKLTDSSRYYLIFEYFTGLMANKFQLLFVLFIFLLVKNRGYFSSVPFMIIFALFLCYFFIYVITPNELNWHLGSSFDRLLHQLTPAFVYTSLVSISRKIQVEKMS